MGERSVADKFADLSVNGAEALPRTRHQVFIGDARRMDFIPDESVHLVVTSPPYWTLKRYPANLGQLGAIEDYGTFIAELNRVWAECYRVLVPGGRLCVNVGDICLSRRAAGRHRVIPLHADITRGCVDLGFDNLAPIFWYKIANLKTEVAGNTYFLGKPYEPNAVIKNDVEYILLLRKPGSYRHPTPEQRRRSLISRHEYARWFRQIWDDVSGQVRDHHPAPYPLELAYRLIRMFSFVGDTVLDPFLGTGTTTLAAIQAGRNSIGIEIEPGYVKLIERKLRQAHLFSEHELVLPEVGGDPEPDSSRSETQPEGIEFRTVR